MTSDQVVGSATAPNTVVMSTSFGCAHCAAFMLQTFPELKRKHLDTGVARFIFREFPLDAGSVSATRSHGARATETPSTWWS